MPPSENSRSWILMLLIFHKALKSNMLYVFDFSQIHILFSIFRTLAKNEDFSPLIISHFQITKIAFFRKSCKKKRHFRHLRNFA